MGDEHMTIELPDDIIEGARQLDDPVIVFPPGYVHPEAGRYKDQPESFFRGATVRILIESATGDQVPAWLDVVDFYDDVHVGRRLGRGRLQTTVPGWTPEALVPFGTEEVFDIVRRFVPTGDGIYKVSEV
jgi:hypothetical protein